VRSRVKLKRIGVRRGHPERAHNFFIIIFNSSFDYLSNLRL